MSVINWANQVNKKIIDSTKIVIGENGFVDNESDSKNFAERYLTSISSPDTLNVVMDFDWSGDDPVYPKDENGYTEFDRFVIWYKFEHKRGVNPFWFPAITKFNADGSKTGFDFVQSYYQWDTDFLISQIEGLKSEILVSDNVNNILIYRLFNEKGINNYFLISEKNGILILLTESDSDKWSHEQRISFLKDVYKTYK